MPMIRLIYTVLLIENYSCMLLMCVFLKALKNGAKGVLALVIQKQKKQNKVYITFYPSSKSSDQVSSSNFSLFLL